MAAPVSEVIVLTVAAERRKVDTREVACV